MRKLLMFSVGLLALSGCGHHSSSLSRTRPDEFVVARQAPLIVPPDYALVPPAPGTSRPQDADSSTQALQALFGGTAPRSAAEQNTQNAAGTNQSEAGIRSNVGDPNTATVDKGSLTRDVLAAPQGDGATARASAGK